MKFLRRKDTKPETPPPPPVIPDAPPRPPSPPQLDALPAPPPPLYARFATGSSLESLDNTSVTPRLKTGSAPPQSRNSVAPSVNTTSTKSSDAPASARPVIRLVSKPRSEDTTTTSQPSRTTKSPKSPPTPAYRRETSSSEGTRLAKPRPPSTGNLPNPFLPPLLRQKNSAVDVRSAERTTLSTTTTTFTTLTEQGLRDATQKRVGERSQWFGILRRIMLTNTCARSGHPR